MMSELSLARITCSADAPAPMTHACVMATASSARAPKYLPEVSPSNCEPTSKPIRAAASTPRRVPVIPNTSPPLLITSTSTLLHVDCSESGLVCKSRTLREASAKPFSLNSRATAMPSLEKNIPGFHCPVRSSTRTALCPSWIGTISLPSMP